MACACKSCSHTQRVSECQLGTNQESIQEGAWVKAGAFHPNSGWNGLNRLAKIKYQKFTPSALPQNWARHRHRSGGLTLVYKAGNRKPALFLWKLGFHDLTPHSWTGKRLQNLSNWDK